MKALNMKAFKGKVLRIAMAGMLALSGAMACLSPEAAAKAEAQEYVQLTVGSDYYYVGFFSTWMWADGQPAYCANPEIPTPAPGTYARQELDSPSGRDWEVAAHLWFGYGSPGFDASLWPATWYDGTAMTDDRYAALTHILACDTYTSQGHYALFGCSEEFKQWCRWNVIGFDTSGNEVNPNASGRLMSARWDEVPSNFEAYQLYTGSATQTVLSFEFTPHGSIELSKASAIPDITDGNGCYSLEGAVYTVYSDEACTQAVGDMVTDANGAARMDELVPGGYWVKETSPAPGYALDPETYAVQVEPDKVAAVNGGGVTDVPHSDPVGMLVAKVDAEAAQPSAVPGALIEGAQGDADLSGAEFTVDYYAGWHATAEDAEASGDPVRSWTFATDGDGFAYLDDEYKVAGGPLYRMSNGDATLPLGTAVVCETKAPQGYNLDDGRGNPPEKYCIRITDDGAEGEAVYAYNSPLSPDSVKRGDFRLVKEVPVEVYGGQDGDGPQEQARVLVPGVEFQLINESENAVTSPETGLAVEPGGVVCTITADGNGLASTKDSSADANGWHKPVHWTGALAYGTYRVHEAIPEDVAAAFKAEYGKDLLPVEDWKVAITEEGQYDPPALVTDKVPQTPLKVVKADAETGRQIPLPCSFQLMDENGSLITYTAHYPDERVMDTWTTNAKGEVTLPMLLEQGRYTLHEVMAPEGYVLSGEPLEFEVTAEYRGWDDPLTLTFEDAPQKGTVTVAKTDSATGEPVDESTYMVKAAADIVTPDGTVRAEAGDIVATMATGEDGKATSPELYLGSYAVYEAKAKDGYALDAAEKQVTLEYQGQEVAVFDTQLDVVDEPTVLKIVKTDSLDGSKPVAGAVFHIWNDEGTFDEEMTTDHSGMIVLEYMKHGSCHLQEIEAPEGYVIDDLDEDGNIRIHDFVVNDQGMIEIPGTEGMHAEYAFEMSNMPKTMGTTAADGESGAHEGQAREDMAVKDVVAYTGLIPGNEYAVSGKLMDKATGEPALDADGKEITAERTFVAEDFTGSVEIEFTFDGTGMAGMALVAFETMTYQGKDYMVHADIADEGQTVRVVDIATQAHLPGSDAQAADPADKLELVDTVSYMGLTPGSEYKLYTELRDAATGNPLLGDDGLPLVAETKFTPERADGTADVSMTIDASELGGKDLVFFERLANADDAIIAKHEDLEDEGQTVSVSQPEVPEQPGKTFPKTGDSALLIAIATLSALGLVSGIAAALAVRKRNESAESPTDCELDA